MGNTKKKNSFIPNAYYSLYNNYYLSNSYKYLIRSKAVHFMVTLIEILLNIIQELFIFLQGFNTQKNTQKKILKIISFIPEKIQGLTSITKLIVTILYILIFDAVYYFLGRNKYKKEKPYMRFVFDIVELFFFRISMLLFLNLYCSFSYYYFLLLLILLIPHLYITSYHFLYNHLYIFVPIFIEYPYDEFSSFFDITLLIIKILLSIIANSKNKYLVKCIYLLLFIFQIFFSLHFIYVLIYHSYLFMKNIFLNKAKVALFFVQTSLLIYVEIIGKNDILNISFLIIFICLFIIFISYVFILYEPIKYLRINGDTHNENMYFYLYLLSLETQPCHIIEKNIIIHYKQCGICDLCKKYNIYLDKIDENHKNKDSIINHFFDILYDRKNKYFLLIKEIILTYKEKANSLLDNISYFYINLSFLLFSELSNYNYVLALNIKILLDVINNQNKLLEAHETQIKQITLCNKFLCLVESTLEQIDSILKSDENKAMKFINLSGLLKKMQKPKYKKVLFNYKNEDACNSKNMFYLCSLLYEEIFNKILNYQIPLRENYQIIEDLINTEKTDKIISLALCLTNDYCKIIRAGKDLYSYKDKNLFDLIPLTFKDYFQKVFLTKILEHFNSNIYRNINEKNDSIAKININENNTIKPKNKITKTFPARKNSLKQNAHEIKYVEFSMIISEEISYKTFYKLLVLKLTPLFNYDYNNSYILLDGSFKLHQNTVITLHDNNNLKNIRKKIISVSKPELENPPELYTMKFEKYINSVEKRKLKLIKILDYTLSDKIITIYSIISNNRVTSRKSKRISTHVIKKLSVEYTNIARTSVKYFDDTASIQSQIVTSEHASHSSALNIKNKKKEDIYKNSKLYKIGNFLCLLIPIIIVFIILELYHLDRLKNGDYINNYSLVYFSEFYKLYFQIFSTILSVVCIKYESNCVNIISLYTSQIDGLDNYFNLTQFLYGESQVLMETMLDKKNNLFNIHQNIGKKNYEEIFEKEVTYTRISKVYKNDNVENDLKLIEVKMLFTDAITASINSFQILTNNTLNEPIYLLNKNKNPFLYFDNYGKSLKNITDYQKALYEMILNYKIYWENFRNVYYKLLDALSAQTKNIAFYIYFYFHISYGIVVLIILLLYAYLYNFEILIVEILNYVNMILNIHDDNFNFLKEFSKKIKNLNIILKIYSEDLVKSIQNLISSYAKYEKYISNKRKNIFMDVPKHLKLIKKNDINYLNFMFYYYLMILVIFITVIISYLALFSMWKKYYLIKDNLYSLLKKDTELEISFYKVINIYDLMIFGNYTLDELATDVFYEPTYKKNDGTYLLKSFYDDLYLPFNYNVEILILVNNFAEGFPYFNFTCENLYDMESDFIEKLELNPEIKKLGKISDKMYKLCKDSGIDVYNDIAAAFAYHYQLALHALNLIDDFSYEGLINHIKKGYFGKLCLHLNLILNFITDIINVKLHKVEYDNLLNLLKNYLINDISIIILLYIIIIIIIIFFFISRLKNFCKQVILLKQVFQLCDAYEL